jgi:hypothetical protein
VASSPKPPRKRFQELKPDQQKRKLAWYKNHQGLTPEQVKRRYNKGTLGPQTDTRGHGQTPERPERLKPPVEGKEDKHKRYRDKIKNAIKYIQDFKRDKWGPPYVGVAPYNEKRSEMAVRKDPETGKMRGVKDLQVIKAMVDVTIKSPFDLGWHGIVALEPDYENAFYYH